MNRRDGFAELVQARGPALHRAAYLMVGDTALAQDLVQEALVKTYAAWPRLREPAKAEAYCRKAITTTAISWFRRKSWSGERPTETLPEVAPHPDRAGSSRSSDHADHAERVALEQTLWQALQQLPARQRAAIVLRYYEDLTEVQTAELMSCAVGTVKSQVAAGLAKLRESLGDRLLEHPDLLPLDPDTLVVTR